MIHLMFLTFLLIVKLIIEHKNNRNNKSMFLNKMRKVRIKPNLKNKNNLLIIMKNQIKDITITKKMKIGVLQINLVHKKFYHSSLNKIVFRFWNVIVFRLIKFNRKNIQMIINKTNNSMNSTLSIDKMIIQKNKAISNLDQIYKKRKVLLN